MTQESYKSLCGLSKRHCMLDGISGLLSWDQETYMPKDAAPIRAEQREILSEFSHEIKTSKELENHLSKLIDLKTGEVLWKEADDKQKAALRAFKRDFLRAKKLPTSFVQEFTKLTSEAIFVWQDAKTNNDFALFQPYLEKIIVLLKRKADYIGYEAHPYDALLDEFEPGMMTAQVEELFGKLSKEIPKLLQDLVERQKRHPRQESVIKLSDDEQMKVCKDILKRIGFNFARGRVDLSSHPFSSAYHPFDSRITTRLESHGLLTQVLTTLHEAGHSFYEMGLPPENYGMPLGEAISLGIHESQSRFWETRIGRSFAFWQYFYPEINRLFPGRCDSVPLDRYYKEISRVEPSFIRVDADEVTYPLHVILRFEIEKELIEGKLQVKDLPARWNERMTKLFGVTPKTNREGCLQDIHWSMGAFGYFPTYTLGNIFCAELFNVFQKDHPDWEDKVRRGEFDFIREWHTSHVHCHGRRYNSIELIEKIKGAPLSEKPYLDYLAGRYKAIFQ
jgi:carboxypeptidase Taq